jgi:hypothetical protein
MEAVNITADWNVNQEKQQRNCPASRQGCKYKLHSKGFLTNRLLLEDKRERQVLQDDGKTRSWFET